MPKQASRADLPKCLKVLHKFYAGQIPEMLRDPLEIILYETIGYLVNDVKRDAAFARLRSAVGLSCQALLQADKKLLVEICKQGGIHPELRAGRIAQIAEIVSTSCNGDLTTTFKLPLPQARKQLKKFPSIGDPGVDKIMLLCGKQSVLALDSNGLRVLTRLGYGEEQKSYSATYKSVQSAVAASHKLSMEQMVDVYRLARLHGQKICLRSAPACQKCPLTNWCDYYQSRTKDAEIIHAIE